MASLDKYPVTTGRMSSAANVFINSNLIDQGIQIAKRITEINPRDYNAWSLISAKAPANSADKLKADEMMRILDPKVYPIK